MKLASLLLISSAVAGSSADGDNWPVGPADEGTPGTITVVPGAYPGYPTLPPPTTVTVTTLYTGNITSTTVVSPTGNPTTTPTISVIVQIPQFVTTTIAYTGAANLNGTTIITVPPTGTVQGTVFVETATAAPLPTLNCDPAGYLIQQATLYRVNITTGVLTLVKQTVGNGTNINAMGYNVGDNLLYAANGNNLIRIAADGSAAFISALNTTTAALGLNAGDIDENSQYWATNSGAFWLQADLKAGSPTYGQVISSGTATAPYRVIDWAFVPGGGDYLYGLGYNTTATTPATYSTYLMRFDRTAHNWTVIRPYGNIAGNTTSPGNGFGAAYASDDGFLFGQENYSGGIYKFSLNTTTFSQLATGPSTSSNDGARCIKSQNIREAADLGLSIPEIVEEWARTDVVN